MEDWAGLEPYYRSLQERHILSVQELLAWLRENVHRHGAKFKPQRLVKRIVGSKISPEAYLKYLNDKFGAIYEL